MERVTFSADPELLDSAKRQAKGAGMSLSAYTARAVRNETLRRQVAAHTPLPEVPGWFDDAERDEIAGRAGAA